MKHPRKDLHRPPEDALWFLPLGGSGEIGMNLSLYGTAGKWLMVDCGVTFGDETTPGIEIIMADIAFIAERRDDLVGLVITHGHEDHIGAIEHLWIQLQCPIYATPFTAELIRSKLGYTDLIRRVKIIELPNSGDFHLGPFSGELVRVTHSIPEAHMLALRTPHGTVLHTGDWKFDPDPIVGDTSDKKRLQEIGGEGILALIGDSTNATVPGRSGSEREVQNSFNDLFGTIKQRIIITCFASNIARVKSIAGAAKKNGRYVTLAGRSLWRNTGIAEACGYLPEYNDFLTENEAMNSPRDKIVVIATGCQGEARSALWRIAVEDHPEIELDRGDTVIFSSRDIPGNEKTISRLQNRLIARGLDLITEDHVHVHVSGHPAQDELTELYQLTRPQIAVPVHGEARHQAAHARLAAACQVPHTIIPKNGQIIRLGPGIHEVVAEVPHGRLGLDGKTLRRMSDDVTKDRKKMSYNGAVAVTVVMDGRGVAVDDPQISVMGIGDDGSGKTLENDLVAVAYDAMDRMPKSSRLDNAAVRHTVAQAIRRYLQEKHGKKPMTEVHVVRV